MTEPAGRPEGHPDGHADKNRARDLHLAAEADRAAYEAETEGRNWLPVLGALLSFAWFGFYLYHLSSSVGLANILDQPSLDFALIILAFFAPPAFLWLLIGYIGRGQELGQAADRLQRQLQLLAYPDSEAGGRVETVAESLKRQSEALRQASEAAAASLQNWRAKLADHTTELAAATAKADSETAAFQQQIDRQRRIFGDMQSALETQAAEIARHYGEAIAKLKTDMAGELANLKAAELAAEERYRQFETISQRQIAALREAGALVEQSLIARGEAERAALRGAQAANEERFGALEAAFERQSRHLQHLIDDQATRLGQEIAVFAERLQEAAKIGADQFGQRVLELESRIGGVLRAAGQDFQNEVKSCGETIERSAAALSQRAEDVKAAVAGQTETLLATGSEMTQRLKGELDRQAEGLRDLARDLARAIGDLTETAKAQSPILAEAAGRAAGALIEAVRRETISLDSLAAGLSEKAAMLEEAIAGQRDRLGEAAGEAAEGFKALLGRQAEEFVAAAEDVAAHALTLEATIRKQRDELMAAASEAAGRESAALAEAGAKAAADLSAKLRTLQGEIDAHFAGIGAQGAALAREVETQTIAFGKISERSADIALAMRESLATQMAEADRAGLAIAERARVMGDTLERQAGTLGESLEALLDRHVGRLMTASAAQAEGLGALGDRLRSLTENHAAALDRSARGEADRLARFAAELEAGLAQQQARFADLGAAQSEGAARFAQDMQALLDRQIAHAAAAIEAQARQAGDLRQSLLQQSDALNTAFADIATATTEMRGAMATQIEDLGIAARLVKREAESMGAAFTGEAALLTKAAGEASAATLQLQGELRRELNDIDAIAASAVTRLAEARLGLAEEGERFRQASATGAENAADAAGLYRNHALGLAEVGDLLRDRLDQMSRAMLAQASQLSAIGAEAVGRQQQINVSLGVGIEQMKQWNADNDQRLLAMKAGIQELGQNLRETTALSLREVEAAATAFRAGAATVGETALGAIADIGRIRQSLDGEVAILAGLSDKLAGMAESVKRELQDQTARLLEAAAAARAGAEASGRAGEIVEAKIAAEIAALDQAGARMTTRLDEMAAAIDGRVSTVRGGLDRSLDRADEIGRALQDQSDRFAAALSEAGDKVGRLGETFRQRREEMSASAAEALDLIEKLRALTAAETKGEFLRTASATIAALNALAVDINGLLESDIPDEIWRKFRDGDRSIFARRLFRRKDAYDLPPIGERYRENEAFRDLVDRYLRSFETLLAQSGRADPDSTLSAALLSADIGKLYLVLAKSTGRQQEN